MGHTLRGENSSRQRLCPQLLSLTDLMRPWPQSATLLGGLCLTHLPGRCSKEPRLEDLGALKIPTIECLDVKGACGSLTQSSVAHGGEIGEFSVPRNLLLPTFKETGAGSVQGAAPLM